MVDKFDNSKPFDTHADTMSYSENFQLAKNHISQH